MKTMTKLLSVASLAVLAAASGFSFDPAWILGKAGTRFRVNLAKSAIDRLGPSFTVRVSGLLLYEYKKT